MFHTITNPTPHTPLPLPLTPLPHYHFAITLTPPTTIPITRSSLLENSPDSASPDDVQNKRKSRIELLTNLSKSESDLSMHSNNQVPY